MVQARILERPLRPATRSRALTVGRPAVALVLATALLSCSRVEQPAASSPRVPGPAQTLGELPYLINSDGSPEANAVALYLHATRYLEWASRLFDGQIDFAGQQNYQDIELLLTDPAIGNAQYLSIPNRFYITAGSSVPAALVAHEMGHRLFWILEDQLAPVLGGPNDVVHCGLLEYFTTSFANAPIVPVGPPLLGRDVSLAVRYPEGLETIAQTADVPVERQWRRTQLACARSGRME